MRDASIAVLRKIGVETGRFERAVRGEPRSRRLLIIEMNPRVSRSSALASKATGFPIAKIAAKLAVGYTLDELKNDITGGRTPALLRADRSTTWSPRCRVSPSRNSRAANSRLTTQMKSVGEVMAIGRSFQESLQKALRGLETGLDGLTSITHAAAGRRGCRRRAGLRAAQSRRGPPAVRRRCLPRRLVVAACRRSSRISIPGSWRRSRIWCARNRPSAAGGAAALDAARLRALKRKGFPTCAWRGSPGQAEKALREQRRQARRAAGLQARGYLRRRVRHFHGLPVFHLRGGMRGRAHRPQEDHDPGRRPQPHRPGHRVRLLLRARLAGAARSRVRDHHGQLQPGNRLHRLRHLRPPVLRAADARGRAGDHRQGEAGGRDRAVRRPDAAEAVPRAGSRWRADHRHHARNPSTWPRTASASRSW